MVNNMTERIADLYANDEQFRNARPIPAVIEAAGAPGLRLNEVLQTIVDGYADRPALGHRARELVTDDTTGRTTTRLLPRFETMSYREVWDRVSAIATALHNDSAAPVNPGDFVATIGFASPEYFTVDLASAYLGLVSVPLQHNAPVSQLSPIIAETEPKVHRGRRAVPRSRRRVGDREHIAAAPRGLRLRPGHRRPAREPRAGAGPAARRRPFGDPSIRWPTSSNTAAPCRRNPPTRAEVTTGWR